MDDRLPPQKKQANILAQVFFLILVGAGFVTVLTLTKPKAAPTVNTTNTQKFVTVPTATEYLSFIGTITSITPTAIGLTHQVRASNGTISDVAQTATVTGTTEVLERVNTNGTTSYKTLTIGDLAVGNHVVVYGSENLAPLTTFSATKFERF